MEPPNLGGRPAECADKTGQRCGHCRNCKRKARLDVKRQKDIEAEARRIVANDKETASPVRLLAPPAQPVPPETFSATPQTPAKPAEIRTLDSSLTHHTKAKVKLASSDVLTASSIDWEAFGPPDPEPEKTEEDHAQDEADAARQERIDNPSALAVYAAQGAASIIAGCADQCAAMGYPWPMWEQVKGPTLDGYAKLALRSFSIVLPDMDEPSDMACHVATGGGLAGAIAAVNLTAKRAKRDASAAPANDNATPEETQEPIDIDEAPMSPDDAEFAAFGAA